MCKRLHTLPTFMFIMGLRRMEKQQTAPPPPGQAVALVHQGMEGTIIE